MFVMKTCPYCEYVERQVEGNPQVEVIDISKHVRNLKQFLDLRDNHPAFDEAKKIGDIGVPCYVLDDGTVTLSSAASTEVGVKSSWIRQSEISCVSISNY